MKYTATELKEWDVSNTDGSPSRSINHKFESISNKFKNAFFVLIGKYDVVDWEENKR